MTGTAGTDAVEIVEVGPRDGLQNIDGFIATELKLKLIRLLLAAGFKRLELGAFVSPRAVPQMADIETILDALGPLGEEVHGMALVPNAKGARRAIAAGVKEMLFVISMTDSHNQSNVRRSTAASISDYRALIEELGPSSPARIHVGLATSFHCPFEGDTPEATVMKNIETLLRIKEGNRLTLADTTGMALPAHVRSLARRAIENFGGQATFVFHGHDTAGFGITNVLAAMESGIRSFDAAAGGLGGCPFAPGATGNVATEDLVYLFDRLGVHTGIDLGTLLTAADFAAGLSLGQSGGHARALPRKKLKVSA